MNVFKKLNAFDRLMTAISFAEANEHDTAQRIIEKEDRKKQSRVRKSPENRSDNRPRLQM